MYDTGDIIIRLVPLPPRQHAICIVDSEGCANIYLNEHDTRERNAQAIEHELAHIKGRDWLSCQSADLIEQKRHKKKPTAKPRA